MRRTTPPKTNLTSLAAAAGTLAFVVWVASFATPHDSIYAQAPAKSRAASAELTAAHKGADVGRPADRGSIRGQG
jgi:hypothetical protein